MTSRYAAAPRCYGLVLYFRLEHHCDFPWDYCKTTDQPVITPPYRKICSHSECAFVLSVSRTWVDRERLQTCSLDRSLDLFLRLPLFRRKYFCGLLYWRKTVQKEDVSEWSPQGAQGKAGRVRRIWDASAVCGLEHQGSDLHLCSQGLTSTP